MGLSADAQKMLDCLTNEELNVYRSVTSHVKPSDNECRKVLEFITLVRGAFPNSKMIVTHEINVGGNTKHASIFIKTNFGWVGCYGTGKPVIVTETVDEIRQLMNFAETAISEN